jgi:hypothetical protein
VPPAGASGRHAKPDQVGADLVDCAFTRTEPNQFGSPDITEHPTREGKVSCAGVLDSSSRWVVRLVDRCLADGGACDQCARHGHPDPDATDWRDHPL